MNEPYKSFEEEAQEKGAFSYVPLMIVVSAPSGAGKTTLCDCLLKSNDDIVYSVSCTTREPRGEEKKGIDYHFITKEQFKSYIDAGHFLEYAIVHGNYYGTLAATIRQALNAGKHVLLDIDVQGAGQIRDSLAMLLEEDPIKQGFLDIFIAPPSLDELRSRLEGRAEDSADVIDERMENAEHEMLRADEYEYQIINDDLDAAFLRFSNIIEKESGSDE